MLDSTELNRNIPSLLTKLLQLRTASMIPAMNAAQFRLDCLPVHINTCCSALLEKLKL